MSQFEDDLLRNWTISEMCYFEVDDMVISKMNHFEDD